METTRTIEDEIDEIRLKIYEETKHMTHAEFNAYIREGAEAVAKEFGFEIVSLPRKKP